MTGVKENSALSLDGRMSALGMLEKTGLFLWEVMRKVLCVQNCVMAMEFLSSNTYYLYTMPNVAMMGRSKMPGLEERRTEIRLASLSNATKLDPQMKVTEDSVMATDGDEVVLADCLEWKPDEEEEEGDDCSSSDDDHYYYKNNNEEHTSLETEWTDKDSDWTDGGGDEVELADWLEWESDEEEEEGDEFCSSDDDDDYHYYDNNEEHTSLDKEETECTDEEDSGWSDEDGDSEKSTESTELWDSFLKNDPYNPLCFSCSIGGKSAVNTQQQNQSTRPSEVRRSSSDVEEQTPKKSTEEGTKKVHFSEEVTVHNLVVWSFASREARNGSCWMQMARDRERFRRRVEEIGEVLSPCLSAHHRSRVWDKLHREAQPEHS